LKESITNGNRAVAASAGIAAGGLEEEHAAAEIAAGAVVRHIGETASILILISDMTSLF